MAHLSPSRPDRALEDLAQRAQRTRASYVRRSLRVRAFTKPQVTLRTFARVQTLPYRLWLHLLIVTVGLLTLFVDHAFPTRPRQTTSSTAQPTPQATYGETVLPLGPIELTTGDTSSLDDVPMPDSAFEDIMALPEVQHARSRQEILAPLTVSSMVVGDNVNLRSGPGQVYDTIRKLSVNTSLTLERVAEDWFVVRTADGQQGWIAAELVSDADTARSLLMPATDIPPPPPPTVAVVVENGVNLRDGPGTSYVVMSKVAGGITIDVLSRFENWFEVRLPDGQSGWVTGDYLQIAEGVVERLEVLASPPDPNPQLVTQTDGHITLRGGPGTAFPKVDAVGGGTSLDLLGRYKEWLKVRTPAGTIAWVAGEVLPVKPYIERRIPLTTTVPALPKPQQTKPQQKTPASVARPARSAPSLSPAQAGGVVTFAMQFTGAPYVWGGSRPGAFDCSGFTKYVYGQYGLNLPHSAAGQYSQSYGSFIDRSNLQPGDLVFFANTYKRGISHVGVYVGGGMVAQALAPGTPLSAVSMNSAYWNSKYYGALRPNL